MPWISQSEAKAEAQDPASYGQLPQQVPPSELLAASVKAELAVKLEHNADAMFGRCTHCAEKVDDNDTLAAVAKKDVEVHSQSHQASQRDPKASPGRSISFASSCEAPASFPDTSAQCVGSLLQILSINSVRFPFFTFCGLPAHFLQRNKDLSEASWHRKPATPRFWACRSLQVSLVCRLSS
jgi:hypothetical protein